jgi:Na+/H+-dicarboxylate symporter
LQYYFFFLSPFQTGASGAFLSSSQLESAPTPDFIRLFIPSNPFSAFANAIVPAVVVFSILLGIALIGVPSKSAILDPLKALTQALAKITQAVAKLAPYGVFALIASLAGTFDTENFNRLQVYIVLFGLLSIVIALWMLPAMISALTPLKHTDIIRELRTALVTAFATGSSLVVIPMLIDASKILLTQSRVSSSAHKTDVSVDVLIPVFYPFPSAAALLNLGFVLFAGWYVGSDISASDLPAILSTGIPSLFGGTFYTMPFLLGIMRLPAELFQIFVSIDVITSRFSTMLSAMHYGTIGIIGSFALVGALEIRWMILLRSLLISCLLVGAVIFGVRAFYTSVLVVPYTMADRFMALSFDETPQPVTCIPSRSQ